MSTTDSSTIQADSAAEESLGQMLGRYKLLEKVGEGGCGVVYVAEQSEPVRRRFALKVIKLGMDTKAVVARFEAERQALAMMDHPNIAKVLDADATETTRKKLLGPCQALAQIASGGKGELFHAPHPQLRDEWLRLARQKNTEFGERR